MSGIIGSKLNIRGSGLVGSLGTDGQHLLSSGAGKTNAFETAAAGSDVAARQDIATLALKLAIQENAEKHNLTNSAIVQFQADGDFNLAGSTDVVRNASEYISSATATSQTEIAHGTGTSIGFSPYSNLSALRDGDTTKNKADAYTRTGSGNEISFGVDWGSGTEKTITGFQTFNPQDDGLHEHNQANGRFRITGSATTITPSSSNGTLLS